MHPLEKLIVFSVESFLVTFNLSIMKIVKKLFFAFALVTFGMTSAFASVYPTNNEEVSKEVQKLLDNPVLQNESPQMAHISFLVNNEREIVVLDVDSESAYIEQLVKNRLNYQKIESNATLNTRYNIDVKFQKSKS
jgi:hypothetical protein